MKNSKRFLLLIFILVFQYAPQADAQETRMLRGKVIDAETGEAVPYAAAEIISKHLGAAANAEGLLQFEISESMMGETVTFSALAYYSRQLSVKELVEKQPFKVELERRTYSLPEFTIVGNSKGKVQLGNFIQDYHKTAMLTTAGMIAAVFMDNSDACDGTIKSISYYIVKRNRRVKSHSRTPFRVRVFAVDSLTGEPGEDLLTEELVVRANGPGWFTVDVSKYNIKVPNRGYFAAMEWVYSKKKYYYQASGLDPQRYYGQQLGIIVGDFTQNSWKKYLAYEWEFLNEENPPIIKGKFTNVLINSEIECFK